MTKKDKIMGQIFQSNQLFLMHNEDMEKAYRNKSVRVMLKDHNMDNIIVAYIGMALQYYRSISVDRFPPFHNNYCYNINIQFNK